MQNSSTKIQALPITETNPQPADLVIELHNVSTSFGEHVVHTDINLAINRAEIFAIVGEVVLVNPLYCAKLFYCNALVLALFEY